MRRIRISVCRRSASLIYWFGEEGETNGKQRLHRSVLVRSPIRASRGRILQNSGVGASRERQRSSAPAKAGGTTQSVVEGASNSKDAGRFKRGRAAMLSLPGGGNVAVSQTPRPPRKRAVPLPRYRGAGYSRIPAVSNNCLTLTLIRRSSDGRRQICYPTTHKFSLCDPRLNHHAAVQVAKAA
jgi:hypothetical protein